MTVGFNFHPSVSRGAGGRSEWMSLTWPIKQNISTVRSVGLQICTELNASYDQGLRWNITAEFILEKIRQRTPCLISLRSALSFEGIRFTYKILD